MDMTPIIISLVVLLFGCFLFIRGRRPKRCDHNQNYMSRQYLAGDGTPMVHFQCYDCNYLDHGHVHGNPDEMAENWNFYKQVRNGKEVNYEKA